MNTSLSFCKALCLPLIVFAVLSACGHKGALYMPSMTDPVSTVSPMIDAPDQTVPVLNSPTGITETTRKKAKN